MMSHLLPIQSLRSLRSLVARAAIISCAAVLPCFAQSVSAPLSVTTFAGVAGQRQATDGAATTARFSSPAGLVIDGSGNLVVADTANNMVRKIASDGTVTTWVGSPVVPGVRPLNNGSADGNKANASFYMTIFVSAGGAWGTPLFDPTIGSITLGADAQGNVYLADTQNNTIRKITPAGDVTTFAGSAGNAGTTDGNRGNARFSVPSGVGVDASGNVYVADSANNEIRMITPDGTVSTLAGSNAQSGSADGTGTAATFNNPSGVAVDASGNIYVTDTGNHVIRKITSGGVVTTLAGSAGQRGTADGTGRQARFDTPTGIAVDGSGGVYVADTGNHAIRRITSAGTVTTVAGLKGTSGSADGTGTAARFNEPYGITVDGQGNVYIADTGNNTIRRGVPSTSSGSLQVTSVPASRIQVVKLSNVALKIAATGSPAPTYQWYKDGTAIAGATSATLSLNSVGDADTAIYSVIVTSDQVTYGSGPIDLHVYPAGTTIPVTIVSEPSSLSVASGHSASFAVEASSTGTLTYQWAKNGVAIPGATSATYSIASAQGSDAANYTVTVSDGVNTAVTTDPATLTVTGVTNVAPTFTTQPISQTPVAGATVVFTAAASGTPTPSLQWQKDGANVSNSANITGATTGTLTISNVSAADVGTYKAVATNSAGSTLSTGAALTIGAAVAPSFTTQPSSQVAAAGSTVTFTVAVAGTPTPTLQWKKDGAVLSGQTSVTLTLNNISSSDTGTYTAVATNIGGNTTSQGATLTIGNASNRGRIINMSVLTGIDPGEEMSFGFFSAGSGTTGQKAILMRAMGPTLAVTFNMGGVLADPYMKFYDGTTVVTQNDNWGGDAAILAAAAQVGAFPFASATSKDAAIYRTDVRSDIGHSIKVSGVGTASGSVIAELYDATPSSAFTATTPRLINVSLMKNVGTVTTLGFFVTGDTPVKILVRAVGPSIAVAPFNVQGTMADPKLTFFAQGSDTVLASNDDWQGNADVAAAAAATGAFTIPANSKDAAFVLTVQPGGYSAQVSAATGSTGVALLEVYEVP